MAYSDCIQQRHTNCISRLFSINFNDYWKKRLSIFSGNSLVLIVDNDADNLQLTKQIVKLLGYRAITAKDGESALKLIEKHQFALVLLEVMLPEIDGINVARYLRENQNLVPVIALTSLPSHMFRDEALMAGCNGYIEKPFQIEYLEAAIKQLLFVPASSLINPVKP
ncbi:response regulator with CheY-like receiver, AAA-type ATPase, and DNA-binding domains [Rivularia sp. PCC 7116]|uniref:response regulator n=1 Tax=Rivularia sp. PCC 7116 TaxID=373994 RepID=UPI00029F026F|nr:response regulator [Rivularia sp. PCC 7116]AFY54669.1 response regulator with CheY-like receiver, AAA-type ATPase, and DNA-binding domains [Rivularia sp. PCC 7116]